MATDWTAGLDVDDDPVAPSISERAVWWLFNHHLVSERLYDRWLERPCSSCGLLRIEHACTQMGRCRAERS